MRKSGAFLSGLLLFSTLFGGVAMAQGLGSGEVVRVPTETTSC